VERIAEVHHLVAALLRVTLAEVAADLPVERRLERVLDAECAARDQEQMRQVIGHREARERVDELGELDRVDVRIRRVRQRGALELGEELGLAHAGMVEPDRQRREAREHVEQRAAGACIAQAAAVDCARGRAPCRSPSASMWRASVA
jgi:hypothetical protein